MYCEGLKPRTYGFPSMFTCVYVFAYLCVRGCVCCAPTARMAEQTVACVLAYLYVCVHPRDCCAPNAVGGGGLRHACNFVAQRVSAAHISPPDPLAYDCPSRLCAC